MSKMVMSGGKHEIKWEEGKMVLIDDSFEHEVNIYNIIQYIVSSNNVFVAAKKPNTKREKNVLFCTLPTSFT